MRWLAVFCLAIAVLWSPTANADLLLTEEEIRLTLSHGPWPPTKQRDPSNLASGNPDAIAFGQALFSDPILSVDGTMSCATCHRPDHGFAEPLAKSQGRQSLDRNTQSVVNLTGHRWFGWDGESDNMWAQSLLPILNPQELGHTAESLKSSLMLSPYLAIYSGLFGAPENQNAELVLVNIGKALAAYQETLVSGKSSFDRFRDHLAEGSTDNISYTAAAQRGLQIFIGRGRCHFCHSGPAFTNGEFHDAGVPYFLPGNRVDQGRFGGLQRLFESPFTLAGAYSDDTEKSGAWAVRQVRPTHADFGSFRVPGLRMAAKSPPFMHDGSLPSLRAVVEHYNEIDTERLHADGEAILEPLGLSDSDIDDLVAFLESVGDGTVPR